MQDQLFDKELGLDLLINPRKRASDNVSVSSRSSVIELDSDTSSVKSMRNQTQPFVNIIEKSDASEGDDISEDSVPISMKSEKQYTKPMKFSYESRESSDDDVSEKSLSNERFERFNPRPRISEEEILEKKRELLYQFDRLEKKGMRLPRKFTLASSLDEMKQEFDRLKRDREIDLSVKLQRKTMMTIVSGIELANNFFDPVGAKLDGWSDSINENLDDYDEIFEELHDKYKGKAKIAPELKLLFMLGGSAFMYHMTNSMFKSSSMPGLDQVLKQNPELMRQVAAATANTMSQNKADPISSGLGGMFSNLFNGGMGNMFGGAPKQQMPSPSPPPQQQARAAMRGPSNVDDILREIENETQDDNDRIELLSTVSESELTSFADDASINNLLMNKKKPRRKGITLDL